MSPNTTPNQTPTGSEKLRAEHDADSSDMADAIALAAILKRTDVPVLLHALELLVIESDLQMGIGPVPSDAMLLQLTSSPP